MAKIILNSTEFNFDGYSRNTYFSENSINSTAYINNLRCPDLANVLNALSEEPITSIEIEVDDEPIYTLSNINAHVNSMEESFNGVDRVNVNLNLQFN